MSRLQAECRLLIFIDPFGPAGFPMQLMARLADFDRVEVLINLNHLEFVQWILPDPSKGSSTGGLRYRPQRAGGGGSRRQDLRELTPEHPA